jgi:integrase
MANSQATRVRFSQTFVDGADTSGQKRTRYWDTVAPGLILNVTDKGAKTYAVVYRDLEGRQREPRLGDARVLTLKQARTAAIDLLAGVQLHGRDPIAERRAQKAKAEQRRERTLDKLSEIYFVEADLRKAHSRMRLEKISYRKHIKPRFGDTPVSELATAPIADAIGEVADIAGFAAANTMLEVTRQMLGFGLSRGWLDANVAFAVKPYPKKSRERVATTAELRKVWKGLKDAIDEGRADAIAAARAAQLALLTLQRRGEVAGLHWNEVDWDAKLWTIPGPRTKNKKGPHAVPLSDMALTVLRQAFGDRDDGFAFLNREGEALEPKVLTRFFARFTAVLGIKGLAVHDLRRTGATMLTSERLGVMGEVISRILNHTPPGPAITRVYNRNTYLPQKRSALELWAVEIKRIAEAPADNASKAA